MIKYVLSSVVQLWTLGLLSSGIEVQGALKEAYRMKAYIYAIRGISVKEKNSLPEEATLRNVSSTTEATLSAKVVSFCKTEVKSSTSRKHAYII